MMFIFVLILSLIFVPIFSFISIACFVNRIFSFDSGIIVRVIMVILW